MNNIKSVFYIICFLFVSGCSSVTYKLEPQVGQAVEWKQGVPQVLVSSPGGSAVIIKPAATSLKVGSDLIFEVAVANLGASNLLVDATSAEVEFTQDGAPVSIRAKSFSEWEQVKSKQAGTSGATWLAMLGAVASSAVDLDAGLGQSLQTTQATSLMMEMEGADSDKRQAIGEEIENTREIYLQRTTLRPDENHSGMIYFGELQDNDGVITVSFRLANDQHRINFNLTP